MTGKASLSTLSLPVCRRIWLYVPGNHSCKQIWSWLAPRLSPQHTNKTLHPLEYSFIWVHLILDSVKKVYVGKHVLQVQKDTHREGATGGMSSHSHALANYKLGGGAGKPLNWVVTVTFRETKSRRGHTSPQSAVWGAVAVVQAATAKAVDEGKVRSPLGFFLEGEGTSYLHFLSAQPAPSLSPIIPELQYGARSLGHTSSQELPTHMVEDGSYHLGPTTTVHVSCQGWGKTMLYL